MTLPPLTRPLTAEDAAHFLRRTAFGGTEAQIKKLVGRDARTVAREALQFTQATAKGNPFDPLQGATPGASSQLLRGQWLYEMIYGAFPLREKLALTWSNHFVIATDKSRNAYANLEYLALLRQHAAGHSFGDFVLAVAQSPAMLRYLDNDQNRKNKPNENFSRELLELFTTGLGAPGQPNYTEQDVKEGARALSGWSFDGGRGNKHLEKPRFVFNPKQHDSGQKTYLGQTGKLTGEDVIRLASDHPAAAVFVTKKLHRAFVSDSPAEADVRASAATFRTTSGDLRAVLEELLSSELFYRSRDQIFRSPTEFIVGVLRSMGQPALEAKALLQLVQRSSQMGQTLFHPETVEGWKAGREWVNDTALLTRMQLAAALTLAKTAPKPVQTPTPLALLARQSPPAVRDWAKLSAEQQTYLLLVSPEFQLI